MAEKIKSALPPDLDLGGGWVVEWDAVDPATGATVPGVIISKTSLLVPGDYGGGGIEAATPYLLVPGPGDGGGGGGGGGGVQLSGEQVTSTPQPAPAGTDVVSPVPTVAATDSRLGLIAYGGSLRNHTHLDDGTYSVVVGDWADAARLAAVSGKGFAYTVSTQLPNPTGRVILDPLGNSPWSNALKPDAYIAKCAALKAANPNLHGIFLDNNDALGVGWNPSVPEAELVAILAHVSAGLASHGLRWLSNTGSYIAGNAGSSDGSLWRQWAEAIAPSFEYLLFEEWQEVSFGLPTKVRRVRGPAWYQQWDNFQKCVGAVPGKFMGATYEWGGDLMFGTYGRASMLTAPGNDPRNIFYASVSNKVDPYGQPWQKRNPVPKVDPVHGTATL